MNCRKPSLCNKLLRICFYNSNSSRAILLLLSCRNKCDQNKMEKIFFLNCQEVGMQRRHSILKCLMAPQNKADSTNGCFHFQKEQIKKCFDIFRVYLRCIISKKSTLEIRVFYRHFLYFQFSETKKRKRMTMYIWV